MVESIEAFLRANLRFALECVALRALASLSRVQNLVGDVATLRTPLRAARRSTGACVYDLVLAPPGPQAMCFQLLLLARRAEIVLEEVPSQLVISNCWAQSLFDPVSLIHVDSAIELDGPYIRAADTVPGSRPSFMINLNDARPFSSLPPASLSAKFGLPDQLRAFLTGLSRIGGTGPPTAGSWRRGTVVMSDIETGPIGWLCISSGYPGEWANLSVPLLGLTG